MDLSETEATIAETKAIVLASIASSDWIGWDTKTLWIGNDAKAIGDQDHCIAGPEPSIETEAPGIEVPEFEVSSLLPDLLGNLLTVLPWISIIIYCYRK